MDQQFANFLSIYDAQGIADKLQSDMTAWDSATGIKAQVALAVLNAGQVERAVTKLEASAAELSAASDRIARWGVAVAWCSLAVAFAALVVALVK